MRLVFIPGLGYDCRIFDKLNLTGFKIEYLQWIEPKLNETIHDYSQRLFSTSLPSSEETVLIGHSLGGIVSQEIANANRIKKVILISSIKSRQELSWFFKLIKPLKLDLFFNKQICIKTVKFWGKNHGFETDADKALFKSMVSKHTNNYLRWALRVLSTWQEPQVPVTAKIIHIHGTNDKTLPYKLVKTPNFTIENGSHICVFKKPKEISNIITSILQ